MKIQSNLFFNIDFVKLISEACYSNKIEIVKIIIDLYEKQKTNKYNDFSLSFFNAAVSGSNEICKLLLDKQYFINFDLIALHFQNLSSTNIEIINIILKNINNYTKEVFVNSLLNQAIQAKNKDIIEFALNEKVNLSDSLFNAVKTNDIDIVNIILNHCSEPSFINQISYSGTALNIAASLKNSDIVKRLLSIPGIDPSLYSLSNSVPLATAVENLDIDSINAILDFYGENIKLQQLEIEESLKKILSMKSILYIDESNRKAKIDIIKRFVEINFIDFNYHFNQYSFFSYICESNLFEIAEKIIKNENVDVNYVSPTNGNTPLITAISQGNIEIAKLLIECDRVNINHRNYDQETALTTAVNRKLIDIIDLITNHKNFNPTESNLNFAFYLAKNEIAKKLITFKDLDVNYGINKTSININSKQEHKVLMVNFNKCDSSISYSTPLISAVSNNDAELVDLIINHPSFDANKSLTTKAATIELQRGNLDNFRKFIKLGSNEINIYDSTGKSLLELSIYKKEILTEILHNETFDSKKSNFINAFISLLFQSSNFEKVKEMTEFDKSHEKLIDLQYILPNGRSIFMAKMNKNDTDKFVKLFIENGANPNEPDKDGVYPLEYAIDSNSIKLAESLIDSGKIDFSIQINEKNSSNIPITVIGKEPNKFSYLHLATKKTSSDFNDSTILSLLLDKKLIDVNIMDSYGETPLFTACKSQNVDAINLLFKVDDLDYLHCNNEGDDVLKVLQKKSVNIKIEPTNDKEEYRKNLLNIIQKNPKKNDKNDSVIPKELTFESVCENKKPNMHKNNKLSLFKPRNKNSGKEKEIKNDHLNETVVNKKIPSFADFMNMKKSQNTSILTESKLNNNKTEQNKQKEENLQKEQKKEKDGNQKTEPNKQKEEIQQTEERKHRIESTSNENCNSDFQKQEKITKLILGSVENLTQDEAMNISQQILSIVRNGDKTMDSGNSVNKLVEKSQPKNHFKLNANSIAQKPINNSSKRESENRKMRRLSSRTKLLLQEIENEFEYDEYNSEYYDQDQFNHLEVEDNQNQLMQQQWSQIMYISDMRNTQFNMIMNQQEKMLNYFVSENDNNSKHTKRTKTKKKSHKK